LPHQPWPTVEIHKIIPTFKNPPNYINLHIPLKITYFPIPNLSSSILHDCDLLWPFARMLVYLYLSHILSSKVNNTLSHLSQSANNAALCRRIRPNRAAWNSDTVSGESLGPPVIRPSLALPAQTLEPGHGCPGRKYSLVN
jgi:hypothetical protein